MPGKRKSKKLIIFNPLTVEEQNKLYQRFLRNEIKDLKSNFDEKAKELTGLVVFQQQVQGYLKARGVYRDFKKFIVQYQVYAYDAANKKLKFKQFEREKTEAYPDDFFSHN